MTQRNSALITLPPLLDQSQNVFAHICDCSIMLQYICQPLKWRIQDDKSSSVCFSALLPPPKLFAQPDEISYHPKRNIAQQYNTSSLSPRPCHFIHSCILMYLCLSSCIWELAPSKGEDDTTTVQASPYHTSTTSSWPPPQVTAVTYHPVHDGVLKKISTHLSKKHHPTSITGMESEVGVNGLLFHRYVKRLQSYNQPGWHKLREPGNRVPR